MSSFVLERLDKRHNRSGFRSGSEPLDAYIKRQAGQDARRRVATVFVLVERNSELIAGYFALSGGSLALSELPPEIASKLPRYESLPATLIGRLAVDQRFQGRGAGALLLHLALEKAFAASAEVASWAVVVDAKDDAAKQFYERHDFTPLPNQPRRLFLSMKDIAERLRRLEGGA